MSLQRIYLSILILLGSAYQTAGEINFSVSINASTNSIRPGEDFYIDCTIFGLNIIEYLNSEVELLLRKNNTVIKTVRVMKGTSHGKNEKYWWTENFPKVNTCDIISVRFDVFNVSLSDEGIYYFYTTFNSSVTQYDTINLSASNEKVNLSNYVIMRHTDALESSVTRACCKYGFDVFEDESFINLIDLRPNESAYFPVVPKFDINNNSISIIKPWISYEGCYNLTVDQSTEMDCTKISLAELTTKNYSLPFIGLKGKRCVLLDRNIKETAKQIAYSNCQEDENTELVDYIKLFSILENRPTLLDEINTSCLAAYIERDPNTDRLFGIPCYNSTKHCDAYCLQYDGLNATCHRNLSWSDAKNTCISLNKSLPGINSDFLRTLNGTDDKSSVCLAVFQSSSIVFQPVIKQAMNKDGNITVLSTNNSFSLPFICGTNSGPEKSNYCVGTTRSVNTSVFTTPNCTVLEVSASDTPIKHTNKDSHLLIIIVMSVVEFLLIVVAVVLVINRKSGTQTNRNLSVTNNEYNYSCPIESHEAATVNIRGVSDNNLIRQTETDLDLHSTECKESIETRLNREYTMTEENGEYDVLRRIRENQGVSPDANIYDRTNNLVSGIYDSTFRRIENKE